MTHALRSYDYTPSETFYIAEQERSSGVEDLMAELSGLRNRSLHRLIGQVSAAAEVNGWDGPGSRALSPATVQNAPALVRLLPSDLPLPEVFATPTGELVFAWEAEEDELTVLLSEDRVGFAALIGGQDVSQVFPFSTKRLPESISDAAREWARGRR
jgi:hypothetical protein